MNTLYYIQEAKEDQGIIQLRLDVLFDMQETAELYDP